MEHHLWINHFQSQDAGRILVDVAIHSPNPFFIFQKKGDHFMASLSFKLSVINISTDRQVYHETWNVIAEEYYYEDTRDPNKFVKSHNSLNLPVGTYIFSIMIIDNDSKHEWKKTETVKLSEITEISEIQPMIRVNHEYKFSGDNIELSIDTLFLKIQVPVLIRKEKYEAHYVIKDMEVEIVSSSVQLTPDELGFVMIPIAVDKEWIGLYEFEVKIGDKISTAEIGFVNTSLDRYFQDVKMMMNVMSAILPYRDYKDLKKMSPSEQKSFLYDYWKEQDPTPDTEENELLNEFYIRVEYANIHFGVLSPGWKSDRGIVYIQYGNPESVETTNRDSFGRTYEIWTYSGKKFIFIDDGFGDYRLFRQTY